MFSDLLDMINNINKINMLNNFEKKLGEFEQFKERVDNCALRIADVIKNEKKKESLAAIVTVVHALLFQLDKSGISFMRERFNEACDNTLKLLELKEKKENCNV
jgi:hypothetical protein